MQRQQRGGGALPAALQQRTAPTPATMRQRAPWPSCVVRCGACGTPSPRRTGSASSPAACAMRPMAPSWRMPCRTRQWTCAGRLLLLPRGRQRRRRQRRRRHRRRRRQGGGAWGPWAPGHPPLCSPSLAQALQALAAAQLPPGSAWRRRACSWRGGCRRLPNRAQGPTGAQRGAGEWGGGGNRQQVQAGKKWREMEG